MNGILLKVIRAKQNNQNTDFVKSVYHTPGCPYIKVKMFEIKRRVKKILFRRQRAADVVLFLKKYACSEYEAMLEFVLCTCV